MKKLISLLCVLTLILSFSMSPAALADDAPLVIDYYVAWPETVWNSDLLSGGVPHSIIPKYYDETHPEIEFNYIYSVDTETAQTKLNTLANTNEMPDLMIVEPKKLQWRTRSSAGSSGVRERKARVERQADAQRYEHLRWS